MKILTLCTAPALLMAASNAAAQSVPQSHEQHQAAGQAKATDADKRCCCSEEMMHKMMMEMMQKHQHMGMSPSTMKPDQHAPAPDQHQHKQ